MDRRPNYENRQGNGYNANKRFNDGGRAPGGNKYDNNRGGGRSDNDFRGKPKFGGNQHENGAYGGGRRDDHQDRYGGENKYGDRQGGDRGGYQKDNRQDNRQGNRGGGYNKENMAGGGFKRQRIDENTSMVSKQSYFNKAPQKSLAACSPNPEEAKV